MMKFFTRLFKSTMCSGCILGVIAIFTTSSSLADECGTSDRVSMPECSRFVSLGTGGNVEVFNLCSERITVKLDIEGASDKLININPGYGAAVNVGTTKKLTGYAYEQINRPTTASCCPRYSRCSFPNEKSALPQNVAPDPYSISKAAKDDPRFKGFQ